MKFDVVIREISELIEADYNPREITDDKYNRLKDGMEKHGMLDPIIVNTKGKRKNIIVGGHQRIRAWKELGNTQIPTHEVSLSPEDERELNISLNNDTGKWDYDKLASFFSVEELQGYGFSDRDLKLDFKQFDPNLKPTATTGKQVTPEDIEKASEGMGDYQAVAKTLDCVCPECAHEFKINRPNG